VHGENRAVTGLVNRQWPARPWPGRRFGHSKSGKPPPAGSELPSAWLHIRHVNTSSNQGQAARVIVFMVSITFMAGSFAIPQPKTILTPCGDSITKRHAP